MRILILSSALLGAAGAAQALEVVHEPVGCVPAGRYARVVARSSPEGAATAGEAQFRTGPDAGWYRVRMTAADGAWQAFLPRAASVARFEYRVVLVGADAATAETAPAAVRVAPAAEGCGAGDGSVAAASMVLQVPPGAPLVPPVPPGFSPVGASAPEEARRMAPQRGKGGLPTKLAIAAGVAGLAGGAVAVAPGGDNALQPPIEQPVETLPTFSFAGTIPGVGATVSRGRDTFGVLVKMDREPSEPLPLEFTIFLQRDTGATASSRCASMTGVFQGAQRPLSLELVGPVVLLPGAPCGEAFEVRALGLSVRANSRLVMTGTVPLATPLRCEP